MRNIAIGVFCGAALIGAVCLSPQGLGQESRGNQPVPGGPENSGAPPGAVEDLSDPAYIRQMVLQGTFHCAPGGVVVRGKTETPGGPDQVSCETDGVRNGPAASFGFGGKERDAPSWTGTYKNGKHDGKAILWTRSGKIFSRYRNNRGLETRVSSW